MRGRVLATVATMLVVGLAAGGLAAYLAHPAVGGTGVPQPVPGVSPAFPTTPAKIVAPYAPDIDYPALATPDAYAQRTIGNGFQSWRYSFPLGWQAYCVTDGGVEVKIAEDQVGDCAEVRFRPVDETTVGGYSLRVKAVDEHVPPSTMVAQKLGALEASPDLSDVTVLDQTEDSVYVTLRTSGNLLRYNFFAWFAAPDSGEATLEMSVAGRKDDENGLRGLFADFADRATAL